MKREYNNYQKVSAGMKRGSFIRRVEFMPVAGNEMQDKSALVMERGVADVKAFILKQICATSEELSEVKAKWAQLLDKAEKIAPREEWNACRFASKKESVA